MANGFVPKRTPEPLPGARLLGLRVADEFQVVTRIRDGLRTGVVARLAKELGVPNNRVLALSGISESSYHARKRDRRRLSPEASSRLYRIARATDAANAYFDGDKEAARRWLTSPKSALGDEVPLEFARTPEGSDYVVALLERMEHGVVS